MTVAVVVTINHCRYRRGPNSGLLVASLAYNSSDSFIPFHFCFFIYDRVSCVAYTHTWLTINRAGYCDLCLRLYVKNIVLTRSRGHTYQALIKYIGPTLFHTTRRAGTPRSHRTLNESSMAELGAKQAHECHI